MLYFITMRQMQGVPQPATDSMPTFFTPCDGKLHFAVIYSAHPSSSKPFQYKVFCKHVDADGRAIPSTPLYGLYGCDFGFLDDDSLQKIATVLHALVSKATDGSMWYEYESHSMPDGVFCAVRNWALLMKNYTRFINVNINELGSEFTSKYSHSFAVQSAGLSQSDRLFGVAGRSKREREEKPADDPEAPFENEASSGQGQKRHKQLQSTEPESLDFNAAPPTLTELIEDSWLPPDDFFEGIELFDAL